MGKKKQVPKHRLFVETCSQSCIDLNADQSHYLTNVLRLPKGVEILVFDAEARYHRAILQYDSKNSVQLEVKESIPIPDRPLKTHVALPIPKGERADWAVEKLTALRVHEII